MICGSKNLCVAGLSFNFYIGIKGRNSIKQFFFEICVPHKIHRFLRFDPDILTIGNAKFLRLGSEMHVYQAFQVIAMSQWFSFYLLVVLTLLKLQTF